MSKVSPLLIVAVAGAGLVLLKQRQAAAVAKAVGTPAQTTADYATPTTIAAGLANFVNGITKGISTPTPAASVLHPIVAAGTDLTSWDAVNGSLGLAPASNGYGWTAPSSSYVTSAPNDAPSIDGNVSAPVYSIDSNFVNNPFAAAAT